VFTMRSNSFRSSSVRFTTYVCLRPMSAVSSFLDTFYTSSKTKLVMHYSMSNNNNPAIRLNSPGTQVWGTPFDSLGTSVAISKDNETVFYISSMDNSDIRHIYRVPTAGGTSIQLSLTSADGHNPVLFRLAPGGETLVYNISIPDSEDSFIDELYSIPVCGDSPTRLTPIMVDGGSVATSGNRLGSDASGKPDIEISPDGKTVVYRADQDTDEVYELYSVQIDNIRSDFPYDIVGNDNIITPADALYVLNRIGEAKDGSNAIADVDCNGTIDATDAELVIERIGQTLD
ncbi:MAG: dockerin type I domain-containing protein, partial [Chloroflexota bacterium]